VSDNITNVYLIKTTNNSTVTLLCLSSSLDYLTTLSNTSPSNVMLVGNNKLGTARKKTALAYFRPCPKFFLHTHCRQPRNPLSRGADVAANVRTWSFPNISFQFCHYIKFFRCFTAIITRSSSRNHMCIVSLSIVSSIICRLALEPLFFSLLEDLVCDRGQGTWLYFLKVLILLIWSGWSSCKEGPRWHSG